MERLALRLTACGAILAPALHTVTDVMEWLGEGFSTPQLWLNYIAFLPMPAIMLGLYAAQRPGIPRYGLIGALVYGFAFVYFAHTTLYALAVHVPDYAALWGQLGMLYTAHGGLMVLGGLIFAWASLRANVFPQWISWCFLAGVALNLVLALLPVPELLQTLGTVLRNAGLVSMGGYLLWGKSRPQATA